MATKSKARPKRKPTPRRRPAPTRKPAPKGKAAPKRKPAPTRKRASTPKRKLASTRKPAPRRRPATTRPPAPPIVVAAPPASDWRADLRREVEAIGPDFAAYLAALPVGSLTWEHADSPELAGLEHWGTELAKRDRRAGIGALVRTAQHGLPIALERAGIGLEGMGFHANEASADGAPVETQIALAAAWLDAPDAAHLEAVRAGNDPSRQLQIWDEDLRPNDDRAHWWYLDVGQCCGHAITRTTGNAAGASYYQWPPETCVGRGLVLAVRGLRCRGTHVRDILRDVRAALVA